MTSKAVAVLLVAIVATTAVTVGVALSDGGEMTLVSSLKRLLGIGGSSSAGKRGPGRESNEELFVYVKIPAPIQPLERASRFEDPLQTALERAGLGEVSGGGSQLSHPDADGRRQIEFCGIDVDLSDADAGLALLHRELARLQVPEGTVLQYTRNGQKHEVPIERQ